MIAIALTGVFYRQMIVFFRIVGVLFYGKYKKSWSSIKRQKVEHKPQHRKV